MAELTPENLVAVGGSRWTKAGKDRVYFNSWRTFIDLELSYYNSGNIASATLKGEHISNSKAAKLLGGIEKVWYDVSDGKFHGSSWGGFNDDLFAEVVDAIKTAIAAL